MFDWANGPQLEAIMFLTYAYEIEGPARRRR